MKCSTCKGTGKVEVENGAPDDYVTKSCVDCHGTGERNIIMTITLWDADNEAIFATEDVPTVSYEQGAEAVARLVKYAQEN